MKIQYCSDLHLEFPENKNFLKQHPIEPIGDILLLAGDIVPFAVMHKHSDFFNYLSDHFETTYWIAGNHEYYHFDVAEKSGTFNEKIRPNVFLLNNTAVKHENVKIVFSTLWSKISQLNEKNIENNMSDFHVIKHNGTKFKSLHFNLLHENSLQFLNAELNNRDDEKTIVVSHHVPTFINYPEKYKGDALNEAFAVELFDLIESSKPDYWIYGHTHSNTNDFTIGKTQLVCNQLGYVKYNEHQKFNLFKHIDLNNFDNQYNKANFE